MDLTARVLFCGEAPHVRTLGLSRDSLRVEQTICKRQAEAGSLEIHRFLVCIGAAPPVVFPRRKGCRPSRAAPRRNIGGLRDLIAPLG